MDLLGFRPRYAKDDPHTLSTKKDLSSQCISNRSSPISASSSSPDPERFMPEIFSQDYYVLAKKNFDEKERTRIKHGHNFEKIVKYKIKKIYKELDLQNDEDQKVAKWHEEIKPRLIEAQRKPPFHIHEYESRILRILETRQQKLEFDEFLREETRYEVARYFSATLNLVRFYIIFIIQPCITTVVRLLRFINFIIKLVQIVTNAI